MRERKHERTVEGSGEIRDLRRHQGVFAWTLAKSRKMSFLLVGEGCWRQDSKIYVKHAGTLREEKLVFVAWVGVIVALVLKSESI
jgi:hypothetical protein